MALSALFTIEGTTTPAEVAIAYDATVNLALLSTTGVRTVEWEIIGVSSNLTLAGAPSITLSGSPPGITASFVADSDQSDGHGVGYCVQCTVSDGKNTATSTGIVGVVGDRSGRVPPVANERLARDATQGWLDLLNDLASGVVPSGTVEDQVLQWDNTAGAWVAGANLSLASGAIIEGAATTHMLSIDPATGNLLIGPSAGGTVIDCQGNALTNFRSALGNSTSLPGTGAGPSELKLNGAATTLTLSDIADEDQKNSIGFRVCVEDADESDAWVDDITVSITRRATPTIRLTCAGATPDEQVDVAQIEVTGPESGYTYTIAASVAGGSPNLLSLYLTDHASQARTVTSVEAWWNAAKDI